MRVLLDEHLNRRLRPLFDPAHEVVTVGERGWSGLQDGPLLDVAQAEFDALVTMDRSTVHQQAVHRLSLGIVLLRALSNRLQDTAPLIPRVNAALAVLGPGEVIVISAED